jgi:diguanylate cyclase (GGDEF)-like protein
VKGIRQVEYNGAKILKNELGLQENLPIEPDETGALSGDQVTKLRMKLSWQLSEKEQIIKENKFLLKQLEQLKLIHSETIEFGNLMENELMCRLRKLEKPGSYRAEAGIQTSDHFPDAESVVRLKQSLDIALMQNEELQAKNKFLKKELDHMKILYMNTVEHSTVLENSLDEKNEKLNVVSVTDYLTKIYNRLKFHVCLKKEIAQACVQHTPLHVIMFDIDHFKQVNDAYGHDKGDSVLVEIVDIVKKIIRQNDVFARWGGEEFMILIPGSPQDDVIAMTERIRTAISGHCFEQVGNVTCSFGLTELRDDDMPELILKRVDEALYASKNSGRNCIRSI